MNVLIVDDDRFVVAALKQGLDWKNLGFTSIYDAYNISDAKSIITQHAVDLLLCDIDMPHGSGLDLLTWIRKHCHDMLVIFLTNYANFEYAQKALELNSFHYFLKPIEYDKLETVICDAIANLNSRNMQTSIQCEHFWNAFIHEELADDPEALETYFVNMHLPYAKDDIFLPIIFSLFPYQLTAQNEIACLFSNTNHQMEYIRTTFYAVFSNLADMNGIFTEYSRAPLQFLAVFRFDTDRIPSMLTMDCETFVSLIGEHLGCSLNSFIGVPSCLSVFRTHFNRLLHMAVNRLDDENCLYLLSDYQPAQNDFPELDTKICEFYLENARYSAFLEYCCQYLHGLSDRGCLNHRSMTGFQVDISQLIYAFLKSRGILANKLFQCDSYNALAANAQYALKNMEIYLRYMTTAIQSHLETSDDRKSVAKSIQEYVNQHYAEDITRTCLTDIFFLDEDYASKLFKRETGISFKNYVIHKRIATAKELLRNTDLPVNTVADHVGYGNYSYFSRLFKKITNVTPIEYRNQNVNPDNPS